MPHLFLTEAPPIQLDAEEESKIIKEACRDTHAFSSLYRKYVQQIYRYLYNRVGQVAAAEDLTSQVFMQNLEYPGFFTLFISASPDEFQS